jgi:hypothetical protein
MHKQQAVAVFSSKNSESNYTNYTTEKKSILSQFVTWFRNFLDNAE